jgi:TolA-binding protein
MRFSLLILLFALLVLTGASSGQAQSVEADPQSSQPEEQSEVLRDTLKRMQIQREEERHKKLVERADQLKAIVESLSSDVRGNQLARAAEKKLKEIERSAKHIRSESGGSDDDQPLDPPPANLQEALKRLRETSADLHASVEKTSRHVISLSVVAGASEVINLVKVIRTYLK